MKNFRLLPALCLSLAAGCVSVDTDALRAREGLCAGNDAPAAGWSAQLADESSYSRNLGSVEAGRVAMLRGRYAEAVNRFRAAVDSAVDRTESSPKLRMTDLAETAMASTVTDDRTREYYLPPYEINLALEYGMLSRLFRSDREGALVDARLSVYVQDTLAGLYGADMGKEPAGTTDTARRIIEEQNAALERMIAATRNSWENPLLWWLTGVLFEADGDLNAAWQSYRKAAAVKPDCAVFAADAARAGGAASPAAGKAKLVVIYESGFVPQRESVKIPVPVYTGFSLDIPRYGAVAPAPGAVSVSGSSKQTAAAPALDVYSLAARDLKERIPAVIVRNLTRAAVQAGAQAAVNSAGNDYARIAMFAGNALISAVRRADTRSWMTLPAVQYVWSDASFEPGTYEIGVNSEGREISVTVPLASGETRILWISRTGAVTRGASAPAGLKGAAPVDLNGKKL